jgi:hypothetical protein
MIEIAAFRERHRLIGGDFNPKAGKWLRIVNAVYPRKFQDYAALMHPSFFEVHMLPLSALLGH